MKPDEGGGGVLDVDHVVLAEVRGRFARAAESFLNAGEPVGSAHDQVLAGCGQVAGTARSGLAEFALSWAGVFAALAESAGLVAANVGAFRVDLSRVDTGSAVEVRI
jgi:hypothetical protein